MRKKILSLAMAAALAVPTLAAADNKNVTIYGQARLSFDRVDSGGGGTGTNQISSNASYFGIKGSKELDSDLSIIWQIEQVVHLDNSSKSTDGYGSTLATRNTFISLFDSTKGILALGRYNTPYKIATRYMDVFGDTIADNRSLMGGASLAPDLSNVTGGNFAASAGASFDGNQGDVIAYVSPAFFGFTGAIAYVAGAENVALSTQTKGDAWSGALLYSNGPLNVNAGYEVHNLGSDKTGTLYPLTTPGVPLEKHKEEAWKVGASYALDPVIIYAVFEQTRDDLGGVGLGGSAGANMFGHNAYYLAGKYQYNNKNTLKAAYTRSNNLNLDGNGSNTGASQWSIGYDRNLDSSTTIYALFTKLNNDSAVNYSILSPQATSGTARAAGLGEDPSAISIGITHKF